MVEQEWVDDDRNECKTCVDRTSKKMAHRMPADVFEKVRKVNHPANRWMFDVVVIRNGWATAGFEQETCGATGLPCLPLEMKHRCDHYRAVGTEATVGDREGGAAWWE